MTRCRPAVVATTPGPVRMPCLRVPDCRRRLSAVVSPRRTSKAGPQCRSGARPPGGRATPVRFDADVLVARIGAGPADAVGKLLGGVRRDLDGRFAERDADGADLVPRDSASLAEERDQP